VHGCRYPPRHTRRGKREPCRLPWPHIARVMSAAAVAQPWLPSPALSHTSSAPSWTSLTLSCFFAGDMFEHIPPADALLLKVYLSDLLHIYFRFTLDDKALS
jgi:hypothetical protein